MTPAQKRFDACDGSGTEVYFRLIIQREFIALERDTQTAFDELALNRANVHFLPEKLVIVPSIFLGVIHRGFGVIRVDTDSDADGHAYVVRTNVIRQGKSGKKFCRADARIFRRNQFGKYHYKFVASLAAYRV